jgi:hypothetical protein
MRVILHRITTKHLSDCPNVRYELLYKTIIHMQSCINTTNQIYFDYYIKIKEVHNFKRSAYKWAFVSTVES